MKIYMEITQDKYALPVAVADSPGKLARIRGVREATVRKILWRQKHGKTKNSKYIVVEVDETEDE